MADDWSRREQRWAAGGGRIRRRRYRLANATEMDRFSGASSGRPKTPEDAELSAQKNGWWHLRSRNNTD